MKDAIYKLVDSVTNKVIASRITLNSREVSIFNYAYALNGKTLRYVPHS